MKYADIPLLSTDAKASRSHTIRQQAPKYLRSVIEDTRLLPAGVHLDALPSGSLQALGGGQDAATYLLLCEGTGVIIKFGYQGITAEAEALRAWKAKSVRVPGVLGSGTVPSTAGTPHPIQYLAEKALVDIHGRLAETGEAFLRHSPEKARHVGYLMGRELSKLHSRVSERSFGDFADSEGNTAPYRSWNNYLLDYLAAQEEYLRDCGAANADIARIRDYIMECTYVDQGRYLHGDFSVRNAAILPFKDSVVLFDPNPVIGDPSWDIAVLYNNYEFSKRHYALDPKHKEIHNRDKQLLIGFKQGYGRQISDRNLLSAQLVLALMHTQYHEQKVADRQGDRLALRVRREAVQAMVKRICEGDPHD